MAGSETTIRLEATDGTFVLLFRPELTEEQLGVVSAFIEDTPRHVQGYCDLFTKLSLVWGVSFECHPLRDSR